PRPRAPHASRLHLRNRPVCRASMAATGCPGRIAVSGQGALVGDDRPRVAVTGDPSVVYITPDKMGGAIKIIAGLVAHRRDDGFAHHVVLTRNRLQDETRSAEVFHADTESVVEYALPLENLRTVIRRLARAIPPGGGVLVVGDLLDLAAASVHDFGRAV